MNVLPKRDLKAMFSRLETYKSLPHRTGESSASGSGGGAAQSPKRRDRRGGAAPILSPNSMIRETDFNGDLSAPSMRSPTSASKDREPVLLTVAVFVDMMITSSDIDYYAEGAVPMDYCSVYSLALLLAREPILPRPGSGGGAGTTRSPIPDVKKMKTVSDILQLQGRRIVDVSGLETIRRGLFLNMART